MLSLSDNNHLKFFKLSVLLLGIWIDLMNIDNNFFDSMVHHIYPSELQLNKANVSNTEASCFGLYVFVYIGDQEICINAGVNHFSFIS